jgi:hypothetical protein
VGRHGRSDLRLQPCDIHHHTASSTTASGRIPRQAERRQPGREEECAAQSRHNQCTDITCQAAVAIDGAFLNVLPKGSTCHAARQRSRFLPRGQLDQDRGRDAEQEGAEI